MKLILTPFFAVAAVLALTGQPPVAELSNLTATAVLGWYTWYTATKTIPQLVHHFRSELAAERSEHRTDRDLFLCEMASERVRRQHDAAQIMRTVHELTLSINQLKNSPAATIPHSISPSSTKGTL